MKSLLTFVCAFLLACACSIGAVVLLSGRAGGTGTSFAEIRPHVIYIYGWMPEGEETTYDDELSLLRDAFPGSEVELYKWNSHADIDYCMELADNVAEFLATQLAALPESKRREIVLVGHSLGARIAIRAMASPTLKDKPIRYGIFLAAAIPHDAPEIEKAIKNSREPNISVFNRQDYVLRHLYVLFGENQKNALGAYGYAFPFRRDELRQFEIAARSDPGIDQKDLPRHVAVVVDERAVHIEDVETDHYGSLAASSNILMSGCTMYSMTRRRPTLISACATMPGIRRKFLG